MNYSYLPSNYASTFRQAQYPQPVYQNGMLYPFSISPYDSTFDMEKDISYSKQLYPKAVKRIQSEIEEECDKLEYKDSYMFDATPDRFRLAALVDQIYERVSAMDLSISGLQAESLEKEAEKSGIQPAICFGPDCKTPPRRPCHGKDCPPPPCHGKDCHQPPCHGRDCKQPCHGRHCNPPRPDYRPDGKPNWLKNLVEIMLYNEMNYRRNRYREHQRLY